jgi:ethanolamine utilization protein
METGELTDRIAARVKEKLEQMGITVSDSEISACINGSKDTCASCGENGTCDQSAAADEKRKVLLILTEDHGTDCHALLENSELNRAYDVQCALLSDYKIDMEQVDTVVLFNLTCANLSKLCSGMADTPYLNTALQAMMAGKKLLVSSDEIEYLKYEKSMPAPMWKKMSGDLDFLKSCGLTVVPADKLVCTAMNRPAETCASAGTPAAADVCAKSESEIVINRKVVTERDLIDAERAGATCIRVKQGCIITDLAKEAAARKNIRFCCD